MLVLPQEAADAHLWKSWFRGPVSYQPEVFTTGCWERSVSKAATRTATISSKQTLFQNQSDIWNKPFNPPLPNTEIPFYALFFTILSPTTEGPSQFIHMHQTFPSTIHYRWQAQPHMVVNSQTALQLPKGKCHRNVETRCRIRLQKLLESLWLAPLEPGTANEWIPQCFIVIRCISETGTCIASAALIEHNAKRCPETPNGRFNSPIKESQIPISFSFLKKKTELGKERKEKKHSGLTCQCTKRRAGTFPKLLCKCCFIGLRLLINIL